MSEQATNAVDQFAQWAIVEIMGHQRYAGWTTEQVVAGQAFLRVDIPQTKAQPAFSKLFGTASIYAISPTTEEIARSVAERVKQAPIAAYELPDWMQEKLRAPAARPAIAEAVTDDDDTSAD
jgi:hypothetical protein